MPTRRGLGREPRGDGWQAVGGGRLWGGGGPIPIRPGDDSVIVRYMRKSWTRIEKQTWDAVQPSLSGGLSFSVVQPLYADGGCSRVSTCRRSNVLFGSAKLKDVA